MTLDKSKHTDETKEMLVLQSYYFFTLLEIALFFSYIWSIVLYVTSHSLSPFSVYQYYLTKALVNRNIDWSTIWQDRKPTE